MHTAAWTKATPNPLEFAHLAPGLPPEGKSWRFPVSNAFDFYFNVPVIENDQNFALIPLKDKPWFQTSAIHAGTATGLESVENCCNLQVINQQWAWSIPMQAQNTFSNRSIQKNSWLPTPTGKERGQRRKQLSVCENNSADVAGHPLTKSQSLIPIPQSTVNPDSTRPRSQPQTDSANRRKPRLVPLSKSEAGHRRLPRKEDAIYNARYKSQPCVHYQKYKRCPLGEDCHFAHGPAELQHPQCHPKFRTRPCKNFLLTGTCPFGSGCYFLHDTTLPSIELSCLRLLDD
ncbi:unnamed protein product [Dibothriocephalus latus]|uniref:C3H1-type domain-containing protein n=1 Tax=Dibothriocephalus latus TaxID=60516 RepID=A0A3P6T5A6_DIBLA|nr:unnamed protein product [Dibothriocephalus latus]